MSQATDALIETEMENQARDVQRNLRNQPVVKTSVGVHTGAKLVGAHGELTPRCTPSVLQAVGNNDAQTDMKWFAPCAAFAANGRQEQLSSPGLLLVVQNNGWEPF